MAVVERIDSDVTLKMFTKIGGISEPGLLGHKVDWRIAGLEELLSEVNTLPQQPAIRCLTSSREKVPCKTARAYRYTTSEARNGHGLVQILKHPR